KAWYEFWDGEVYVCFSGGKDSTVLLHLVRQMYPDVPGAFTDTGLEYPEIRDFVKTVENVEWLRPAMNFRAVIEKYGYPVVSKRIAGYVHDICHARSDSNTKRLRLTGIRKDGTYSPMSKISKKWVPLCDAPFKVSGKCCDVLKMRPTIAYEKRTALKPYLGMMASEGMNRRSTYFKYGCNAFDLTRPRSTPLAFWTDRDIWDYVRRFNVPYSPIYDMGYSRTGCMFCMFGVHMEKAPNRFQQMAQTHPKQYRYCMKKLRLAEVLDFIGVSYEPVSAG
ncbi:MAG: phosphoadenosine phosphosulfate reductase family protein, partial [Phycisphaerae bacterium]|nr:phosphoadenosine phosphosulfate reductase family protein [Phycisphaerae bacterium]